MYLFQLLGRETDRRVVVYLFDKNTNKFSDDRQIGLNFLEPDGTLKQVVYYRDGFSFNSRRFAIQAIKKLSKDAVRVDAVPKTTLRSTNFCEYFL